MHYLVIAITFLATLIANLLTRSVTVIFEIFTKKLLVIGALITVLAAFVVAFYLLIQTTIGAISATAPPYLSQAASLVVPDNLTTLIALQITARIARWTYEWNVKVLQWRL